MPFLSVFIIVSSTWCHSSDSCETCPQWNNHHARKYAVAIMASPKSKPLSHKHKSSFYAIKMLVVRCLSQQTTAINANQQHCFTISTGPMRTRRRAHTFCVGHLFRRRNGAGARLYCRWRRRCVSMRVGHHRATTTERHRHTILVLLAHTHTQEEAKRIQTRPAGRLSALRGPTRFLPPNTHTPAHTRILDAQLTLELAPN